MYRRTFLALPLAAAAQNHVAVIAHRGEHLHHPENTLSAIRAAIDAGAHYVELDVRTSLDGALVLSHNSTVDARTNGRGPVRQLTLAQLRALDAGNGERIPTFDEALAAIGKKCGLYLDWKDADATALLAPLRRHRMIPRTVVYGSVAKLTELHRLEPALRVMPEAVSAESLTRTLAELKPKVVAFDRRDFTPEIIAIARAASVDIFVDRLGPDDNEAAWRDAVERGATGIQTDHPAELAAFLRTIPSR